MATCCCTYGRFLQAYTFVQIDIIIFLLGVGEEKQIVNKVVEHYKGETWLLLHTACHHSHLHSLCRLKPIICQ
jgi:hypothetical protein